jgi:uncharacterized protein
MINTGKYNELKVLKKLPFGLYLTDGTEEILLPLKYVPENTEIDDLIEVFIYNDNENRPIATTLRPYACVGDFAFLKVNEVNELGAFLEWGIAKDLFVPFREQRVQMQAGRSYLVFIYIDEETNRLVATSKTNKFISNDEFPLDIDDEVELLISEKTDIGYKAIINNRFIGLLYSNELFESLNIGDKKRGFIKLIRPDNKIDLSLQRSGYEHIEDSKYKILHQLEQGKGHFNLGDKSTPEEIYKMFKMSKKAFKKTIGGLYRDKIIEISDYEIKLLKK